MKLLALDTSTEACCAAIMHNDAIIERFDIQPNRQSQLLLPMIDSLLSEAGWSVKDLDAIAFGRGPGSFTGLRIAASVTQGIAFAHDLPVIPVSSLQTIAQSAYQKFNYAQIAVAIDAHIQAFYYGVFELSFEKKYVEPLQPERWIAVDAFSEETVLSASRVGSGWRYFSFDAKIDVYPHAGAMLVLAKAAFEQKAWVLPEQAVPVYLYEPSYNKK